MAVDSRLTWLGIVVVGYIALVLDRAVRSTVVVREAVVVRGRVVVRWDAVVVPGKVVGRNAVVGQGTVVVRGMVAVQDAVAVRDTVVDQPEHKPVDKAEVQGLEQAVERSQFVRLCSASSGKVAVYV